MPLVSLNGPLLLLGNLDDTRFSNLEADFDTGYPICRLPWGEGFDAVFHQRLIWINADFQKGAI
jgi:hypothetical protein